MKQILLSALCFSAALTTHAAVVVAWDAYAGNVTGDLTVHTVAENLDTGAGLNDISRHGVIYFNKNFTYSSSNWNTTNTLDVNDKYLSFSVSASEGYEVTLTDLVFYINGGNPAPGTGLWGYTTDGGSTWTFSDPIDIRSNALGAESQTWDFVDFTVEADVTVEFRFWAYGTDNVGGGTTSSTANPISIYSPTGDTRDVILNGAVTQIPEAGSFAWLAGASALIALLIRRLRQ